jgi:ankyrin repeat protein
MRGNSPLRHVAAWIFTLVAMVTAASLCAQSIPAPVIPENHPMLIAARAGDKATVLRFLAEGVSINSCDKWGHTAVSLTLDRKDVIFARDLLAGDFDPKLSFKSANNGSYMQIGIWPLTSAITADASDLVSTLLARGMEPYSRFYAHGDMVFQAAVRHGRTKILELLLASVKDGREHVGGNSYYYLLLAMSAQSVAIVDVLARHGLDVDARSTSSPRQAALHAYARTHWADGIAKLIALGADPACQDEMGITPEAVATKPEIKRLLVAAEAQAQTKLAGRSLPLGRGPASAERPARFAVEIVKAALESEESAIALSQRLSPAALQAKDNRGWTLLTYALQNKRVKWADALIEQGIDVKTITHIGCGMVAFAADARSLDLVRKLVAKGAAVDAAEHGSPTALLMAAQGGNLEMIELLLSLGANPEPPVVRNAQGHWVSPAMGAARFGNLAALQRLAAAGADLKALDALGEGLPIYAIRSGKPAVLRWILAQGVPLAEDAHFKNPLKVAVFEKKPEMIEALLKLWPVDASVLAYARTRGIEPSLLGKIAAAAGVDEMSPEARFWNQHAFTREEIARHLDAGGNLNFRGRLTPLQRMAQLGNYEGVKLLLERGADPSLCGTDVHKPPMFFINALVRSGPEAEEKAAAILRLFLDHGVSPNAQRKDQDDTPSETLLVWALRNGDAKCVKLLLDRGANPWLATPWGDAFDVLQQSTKFHAEMKTLWTKMTECGAKYPREPQAKTPAKPKLSL